MSQPLKFQFIEFKDGISEGRYSDNRQSRSKQPQSEQLPSQHSQGKPSKQKSHDEASQSQGTNSRSPCRKESEDQPPRRQQPPSQQSRGGLSKSEGWKLDPVTKETLQEYRRQVKSRKEAKRGENTSSIEPSQSVSIETPEVRPEKVPRQSSKTNKRGHDQEGSPRELDKRPSGKRRAG
ncbi:hypothetical protein BDV38DRAFT_283922 [Aspergillus pseudotamarii]|uniref:Uncharacterized protein n=1 Tax=Aspergillus pseudotamarii TaxID=132259 RepID=A0A5N6SSR1_ASPPS|nr:uncharacterized protein BDV38DRAFT_283922 [Aspergillus pseudotamarii]KAE8136433.1 hypothetical protein BDV38DRAFT_283922 [Aspergillus pseudotamarii]